MFQVTHNNMPEALSLVLKELEELKKERDFSEKRDPLPELLTVAQLAKLLSTSENSIYQMVNKGAIPHYKLPGGRKLYFKKKEIMETLVKQKIGADE